MRSLKIKNKKGIAPLIWVVIALSGTLVATQPTLLQGIMSGIGGLFQGIFGGLTGTVGTQSSSPPIWVWVVIILAFMVLLWGRKK